MFLAKTTILVENKDMALDDIKKKQLSAVANNAATQAPAHLIRDQFENDSRFYVQRYYLDSIAEAWERSGLPTPAELIERLSEDMPETRSFMTANHSSKDDTITIEFRAAPDQGDKTDFVSPYATKIFAKMTYDINGDAMFLDEVSKSEFMEVDGRDLVRKMLETGFETGRTKVGLKAWLHGNHIWTSCFRVSSVKPEYTRNVLQRLDKISD